MSRNKLYHFAEMKSWSHVIEPVWGEPSELPGQWGDKVILELGCGKGHYTLALARLFPNTEVVGIDIKGSRMWHGAKVVEEECLRNSRFLRIRIEDLAQYFLPGEIDEIWIPFPDPHLRKGKANRRLTSPRFLNIYKSLLKPGGKVHLKTDDENLFEYSKAIVCDEGWKVERIVEDVHGEKLADCVLQSVQTQYEQVFLKCGKKIHYVCFSI